MTTVLLKVPRYRYWHLLEKSTVGTQARRQVSVTGGGGGGAITNFGGARKLYFSEFESVDLKKKMFKAKFNKIWGKDQKKEVFISKKYANIHEIWSETKKKRRSSSQNKREFSQILVFISKSVQISTNSEVKTKKKDLHPKIYANFYEFWGEATKKTVFIAKSIRKNSSCSRILG